MSAYDDGFSARQRGLDNKTNPHEVGSQQHLDWLSGWWDLEEHFRDRNDAWEYTFGTRPKA